MSNFLPSSFTMVSPDFSRKLAALHDEPEGVQEFARVARLSLAEGLGILAGAVRRHPGPVSVRL